MCLNKNKLATNNVGCTEGGDGRTDARSDHAVLDLFVTFSIKGKSKENKCAAFNKGEELLVPIDLFLISNKQQLTKKIRYARYNNPGRYFIQNGKLG